MPHSKKDLFDESTMSFGEHLEVLRVHLWKALLGLMAAVIVSLFFGNYVIDIVRGPLDDALRRNSIAISEAQEAEAEKLSEFDVWETLRTWFTGQPPKRASQSTDEEETVEESGQRDESKTAKTALEGSTDPRTQRTTIQVQVQADDLARALNQLDAQRYPPPPETPTNRRVALRLSAREFRQFRQAAEDVNHPKPVVLTVQEAFLTYLKVAFVTGFVIASPWVFYQLWLFVAAGLYPHERKYVYLYLPMSLLLFASGAVFCFYVVFPYVLDFLLGFSRMMGVEPNIRLSEWISFAIMLPVMFGLSFQLPLVMLFLERISIFEANDYREKRRMAILVIAILSMLMTPADPMSMLAMMFPLIALYELGILMCRFSPTQSPFGVEG